MNHRQKSQRIAALEVENWNLRHRVGDPVLVIKDNGDIVPTTTRSAAEVSSSGHAVIWLTGISGYYLLDRVTAI